MKINKEMLISYGKFLFRSGEEAFRYKKHITLDVEISAYIKETFKDFLEAERRIQEAKEQNIDEEIIN